MTQLAEHPAVAHSSTPRVSHWIDGSIVAGTSGRSGAVYDPATGQEARRVDFATADEVGTGGRGREGRLPRVARDVASRSAPRSCSASGTWWTAAGPSSRRC